MLLLYSNCQGHSHSVQGGLGSLSQSAASSHTVTRRIDIQYGEGVGGGREKEKTKLSNFYYNIFIIPLFYDLLTIDILLLCLVCKQRLFCPALSHGCFSKNHSET